MTEEERKVLLLDLRNADLADSVMCDDAANEIEQLADAVKFWQEQADKGRRYIEANERERK